MLDLRKLCAPALVLALLPSLCAQPAVLPPNIDIALLAGGIAINGEFNAMGVDWLGNVYVVDEPPAPAGVGPRVHRIRPGGAVDLDHADFFGDTGQMAYHPLEGLVYIVESQPFLPVINSIVWRLEPAGGATMITNVPVVAQGFTIDNQGNMFFGGTGVQGPGLYRRPAGSNVLQYLGPGFGANAVLQSLVSGDLLIASGNEVRRWTPLAANPLPYWQGPIMLPNTLASVTSLARTSSNQIGKGATIGWNTLGTFCFCGDGKAFTADLVGSGAALFANESYAFPDRGLRQLATGIRQDLYWASLVGAPGGGYDMQLWRVRQVPAHGSWGSLLMDVQGGQLTMDLYGDPAGGDGFTVGLRLPPAISLPGGLFIGPYGALAIDPFGPNYLVFLDGIGIFGPPNPFAHVPVGGHFGLSLTVPPINLSLQAEGVILDPQHAVNGAFTITNVDAFSL